MQKEEVKKYFKAFMLLILYELLTSVDILSDDMYKDKMKGEILEVFLKSIIGGLEYLKGMPTKGKENFISSAEKMIEEMENE